MSSIYSVKQKLYAHKTRVGSGILYGWKDKRGNQAKVEP
jgi:hypothetical protein